MSVFDTTNSTTQQAATSQQAQANTGTTANTQANTYTAGQQGVQGNIASTASNLLSGDISQFMPTPAVTDYANYEFNKMAPQIAAQYGAGSNQINAQQQALMLGLTAQGQQNAYSNGAAAINAASNFAMTPVGVNQTGQQASTAQGTAAQNQNTTQATQSVDYGGLLDLLGFGLAGSGGTFPTSPSAPTTPTSPLSPGS